MTASAPHWIDYSLPLRRPWVTQYGQETRRRGRLCRIGDTAGLAGWGDASPLPALGITPELATRYALECASLDLAARQARVPLYRHLGQAHAVSSLQVNCMLGSLADCTAEQVANAYAQGFRCFKLKLGVTSLAQEMAQLEQLTVGLPGDARWRLDANAAWTLSDARYALHRMRDWPIEGLEEPMAHADVNDLARLQESVPFPLAIDESWHLVDADFFSAPCVRRLILKPARLGGLKESMRIAEYARRAGLDCVVTSALESACGLRAAAHLAAAIAPDACHGLATGDWLLDDTGARPRLTDGRLVLDSENGPDGTGFTPATAYLSAFSPGLN